MKTGRLLTVIATLSISSLVFFIVFNSVILGDDKVSESATETLIPQIQDLQKEIEVLKGGISKLESGQKIPPTVARDLPSVNAIPHMNQSPKGSMQMEINGTPYYIIPLQNQSVDK